MKKVTVDGNTAAAHGAYAFSEFAAIYPITPSSSMSERFDEWSANGRKNLFGESALLFPMQSESGAAGALHGGLSGGALTTTFTSSQGLLLMIPELYKLAGELLPCAIHVAARSVASHALCIFGDHSDVMACRQTGVCILASASVQEAADFAIISHLSALSCSLPFLHFFDGFRTSHEVSKIEIIDETDGYKELLPLCESLGVFEKIQAFRSKALSPDSPVQRGTAQNPDVFFQNRERANPVYENVYATLENVMNEFGAFSGRNYRPFDYYGDAKAESVLVIMGSGGETAKECLTLAKEHAKGFGVLQVRLYRPFSQKAFCAALPQSCKTVTVLDRTKENGGREPLYLDVCAALKEENREYVRVLSGRYGLGSKDFNADMVWAILQNMRKASPKVFFTVGIADDLSKSSLDYSAPFPYTDERALSCKIFGFGSDGTVGACKETVKIIGEYTDKYAQAYFEYDSKKSGGVTVSHLRFSDSPIRSAYLVDKADFIACHEPSYLFKYDVLKGLKPRGKFLLNTNAKNEKELAWLPAEVKRALASKEAELYVLDGFALAEKVGLSRKISTLLQTAFFALNRTAIDFQKAVEILEQSVRKRFSKKGVDVVERNLQAIRLAEDSLVKIEIPEEWKNASPCAQTKKTDCKFFNEVASPVLSAKGNELPVSAFSADGSVPTGTTKFEKRGVALFIPEWNKDKCIQCAECSFACPHATIRPYLYKAENAPDTFAGLSALQANGYEFRIQVFPLDCMGCGVCAAVCPVNIRATANGKTEPHERAINMVSFDKIAKKEEENRSYAQSLPPIDDEVTKKMPQVKKSQFSPPLFEFSGACAGCGETPYIKVLTQLFGEKMIVANATGCSSIYGGSYPTCPYTKNQKGKGPAWANSLFEDNAEFGLGLRFATKIRNKNHSVWCVGGDGWAYDIGFGGLAHVLASGENVNVLVLDSEVYSNTGGQLSKATPRGAMSKFASNGKALRKKDAALLFLSYGNVYVAKCAMGANKNQFLTALKEAESYDGPSVIFCYSPCIAHGFEMQNSQLEQKRAVECGYWHLFRYNPDNRKNGNNPFTLDSKEPTGSLKEFMLSELRFAALAATNPTRAEELFRMAEDDARRTFSIYKSLAENCLL